MVAPVAQDSGALISEEYLIEVAREVCGAFSDPDAAGGLTRSEIRARVDGAADQATLDARFNVFVKLELLRPVLEKKHQQRYRLNPAGMVGQLVFERIGERGGIDELLTMLDRTWRHSAPNRMTSSDHTGADASRRRGPRMTHARSPTARGGETP
jgi:hypothetical protein